MNFNILITINLFIILIVDNLPKVKHIFTKFTFLKNLLNTLLVTQAIYAIYNFLTSFK